MPNFDSKLYAIAEILVLDHGPFLAIFTQHHHQNFILIIRITFTELLYHANLLYL